MLLPLTTLDATREASEEPVSAPNTQGPGPEYMAALQRQVQNRANLDPERRAMVEALAQKHHIPLNPQGGFTDKGNPRREQMSDLGEAAKVAALPMAGQLIGGVVGGIPGQTVGALAGLGANKVLGISNPDSMDAAITAGAPTAGKLLTRMGRRSIPGVEAAEQQIGAEMMGQAFAKDPSLKAATTAAYDRVEALGSPAMPATNFQGAVNKLFDTEVTARKYGASAPAIRQAVKAAGETLQAQNGTMPFRDVEVMLKRYRQKTTALEAQGGEVWGAYKDLRKALFDDMAAAEAAGGQAAPNVQAMKEAIAASKKQIAHDELAELVEKYGTRSVTVNGQTFEIIEPTKVLNKLKDIGFEQSAGKEAAKKVELTLKQLAAIPKVDTNTGTGVGTAGRAWAMAGTAAAGATYGQSLTAGLGGAAAAYGAIKVHDAVASLAMSDRGRNFLVKMFKANNGRMGERTAQMLQFAATQFEDTGEDGGGVAHAAEPQSDPKWASTFKAHNTPVQGPRNETGNDPLATHHNIPPPQPPSLRNERKQPSPPLTGFLGWLEYLGQYHEGKK